MDRPLLTTHPLHDVVDVQATPHPTADIKPPSRDRWPGWGEHTNQVATLCGAVGETLGLPSNDLAALHVAALYHDLRNIEGGSLPRPESRRSFSCT